ETHRCRGVLSLKSPFRVGLETTSNCLRGCRHTTRMGIGVRQKSPWEEDRHQKARGYSVHSRFFQLRPRSCEYQRVDELRSRWNRQNLTSLCLWLCDCVAA